MKRSTVMSVKERFLKYVAVETTSDENSPACPSSEKEWNLAHMLADEMKNIGINSALINHNTRVAAL